MTPENTRSDARYVTDSAPEQARSDERFRLMRLCVCEICGGTGYGDLEGKQPGYSVRARCPECRGEGRTLQEVATAANEAGVGLALVQLGREGEFDECPFGLIDSGGEVGLKWLVRPWLPSPRNLSDAGRILAKSKQGKGNT